MATIAFDSFCRTASTMLRPKPRSRTRPLTWHLNNKSQGTSINHGNKLKLRYHYTHSS